MVCQPCAPMDAEAGEDENDEDDQEDDPILSLPPVLVATSPLVLVEADFVLSTRVRTVEGFDLPKERQALLEELWQAARVRRRGGEFLEWKQKGRAAVVTTLEDLDELVSRGRRRRRASRAAERANETTSLPPVPIEARASHGGVGCAPLLR